MEELYLKRVLEKVSPVIKEDNDDELIQVVEFELSRLTKEEKNYKEALNLLEDFKAEYCKEIAGDIDYIFDEKNFIITIELFDFDIKDTFIKEELHEKYFKDYENNVQYRYYPNTSYSSIY